MKLFLLIVLLFFPIHAFGAVYKICDITAPGGPNDGKGYYWDTNKTGCASWSGGPPTGDSWKAECCTICPPGTFCNPDETTYNTVNGIITSTPGVCEPDYYCPRGSASMKPCEAGYYCPNYGMCNTGETCAGGPRQNCGAEYYCPGWVGGTYQGRMACNANYRYNTDPNKIAASDCKINCGAGKYVATINGACVEAQSGYWSGQHTVSQGSTSTQGTHINQQQYNQCPTSPAYNNSDGNRDSVNKCYIECSSGQHVLTPQGACTSCPANASCTGANCGTKVYWGSSCSVLTCTATAGYYCDGGTSKECPKKSQSTGGQGVAIETCYIPGGGGSGGSSGDKGGNAGAILFHDSVGGIKFQSNVYFDRRGGTGS